MATKRKCDATVPAEESDQLLIRPLGAGQEVGRSCIILEFKGRKIMLDCGIHPGLEGMDALPFHLDHCGALPWFLQKTSFKGRTFMTHATKAIYRWLLSDYVKVSNISADDMLYTETDLEESMEKIETINFHEVKEVAGIKFWCYHAGHDIVNREGRCLIPVFALGRAQELLLILGEERERERESLQHFKVHINQIIQVRQLVVPDG
ncbi:hypothetical protein F7725_028392 [Dissostichus mawsoni]|uniref:Uncharacterized protein n=1 Tax=Dissostichus mawsoni TaxID=36200 RepID=A0A7J5XFN0_DISMA|nr:hypothetical protein F7725_028392 [Dissostichus mawsoni]